MKAINRFGMNIHRTSLTIKPVSGWCILTRLHAKIVRHDVAKAMNAYFAWHSMNFQNPFLKYERYKRYGSSRPDIQQVLMIVPIKVPATPKRTASGMETARFRNPSKTGL